MSREYRISWNRNQLRKLNSAVRKYNNALRRAAKADPLAHIYLPQEVSYKELKSSITTARALKNTVNRLTRGDEAQGLGAGAAAGRLHRHPLRDARIRRAEKRAGEEKEHEGQGRGSGSANGGCRKSEAGCPFQGHTPVVNVGSRGDKAFHRDAIMRQLNMSNEEQVRRYYTNYMKALWSVFGGFPEHDADIERIEETMLTMAKDYWKALVKAIEDSLASRTSTVPLEREAKMKKILGYWMNVRAV